MAEKLVSQWPHAKPPDMAGYLSAIASVLGQYPIGIARDCVDPTIGLARTREFPPTVACVINWCDERLEYQKKWAQYVKRRPDPAPDVAVSPETKAQVGQLLAELADYLRGKGPLPGAKPEDAA
jgi:hypothetical protein